MHSKKDERDWVFIRDNEILNIPEDQNKIFRILKLSYDHLPSHLKQCFSYCAIFSKDYRIKRETLIQLWMAEGFIQPYDGNDKLAMEDIGNNYFFSLLRNSLLQDIEIDEFGDVKSCKMHDLVHDLAQSVAGTHECMIVEASKIGDISEVRRLHLFNLNDEMLSARVSDALRKAKKLRTLIIVNSKASIITNLIKEIFHNNTLLRVLDLRTFLYELPSEISNLKHLRYLDLSWSSPFLWDMSFCLKFPHSISTLYHLQTLKCRKQKLPKDTNNLINLRHFVSSSGTSMMRLGQLTCLRTLQEFSVCDGDGYGIEELGSLNSIGGDLTIYALGNVKGGSGASRIANLEGKPNFRSLSLQWGYSSEKENDEMVLEGLRPHPHLKSLQIHGFGGAKLPTWMMMGFSSCLPNLVVLKLQGCKGVEQLPSLGELPLLRILYMWGMEGVRCLGKEFHGTAAASFPSLKEFTLESMINLEEWVVVEEEQQKQQQQEQFPTTYFPHLEKLVIRGSPILKVAPTFFPSLKELFIENIDGRGGGMLVSRMITRNLTSLTKVDLKRVEELQFLPQALLLNNNTTLQSLSIVYCPKFEGFVISKEEEEEVEDIQQVLLSGSPLLEHGSSSNNKQNSSLEYLKLYECPVLTFLPDLRCCTSLRELTIEGCTALTKSLPGEDDLKKWVELQKQQQFPSSTTISTFLPLEKLKISKCPRLKVAMVTRNLNFLTEIDISELEELQFLPQGLLLNNNTLRYLTIAKCPKFEGFVIPKEEDIQQVVLSAGGSSLESLELLDCPVLTFLPDLCYFTSLWRLKIEGCKEFDNSLPGEELSSIHRNSTFQSLDYYNRIALFNP